MLLKISILLIGCYLAYNSIDKQNATDAKIVKKYESRLSVAYKINLQLILKMTKRKVHYSIRTVSTYAQDYICHALLYYFII